MKTMVAALIAVAGGALPVAAQVTPPAPPVPPAMQSQMRPLPPTPPMPPMPLQGMRGMRAFGTMSEAGRATMMAAMRGNPTADRADRERVRTARDRMLTVLDAERLDTAALRRAMDDERDAANTMKTRRQSALAAAFTSLSAADRKAFVADARSMRDRVERRVDRKMRRGMHKDMHMTTPDRIE